MIESGILCLDFDVSFFSHIKFRNTSKVEIKDISKLLFVFASGSR